MSDVRIKTLNNQFLTFGKPDLDLPEISAATQAILSGWIGTGPIAKQFEHEFENHLGGGHVVAVSSCSMGLILALKACDFKNGEVITSPLTFAATVNSIIHAGLKPVFCDVDSRGCLDPNKMKVTSKTRAIMPVHYTGSACKMDEINSIAKQAGLVVIEDAAHSFGGTYKNKPQGTLGNMGVFSLYATKNITAGEGGMVYTSDEKMAYKIRVLSNQGQSSGAWGRYSSGPIAPYSVVSVGYKGNMPDILAAIGLSQLKRWHYIKSKRDAIWDVYEQGFSAHEYGHSHHLYTIQVSNRNKIREKLWQMGIGTGIHYTPLHLEPAYKYLGYKKGDFPMAENIGEHTLSLPVSPTMQVCQAEYVVEKVKLLLKKGEKYVN